MVKFYFESLIAAAAFCNKHNIPSPSIKRFGKRAEFHVPAEWAHDIRCAA